MKLFTTLVIVILAPLVFNSCQIRAPNITDYYQLLDEQTVFIEAHDIAKAAGCTEKGLAEGKESEICKMLMHTLPDIHGRYVGTGTFIRLNGKIRVLTAEHVCYPDEVPKKLERDTVIIDVEKVSRITVASGKFKSEAKILKKSKKLDLCLLELVNQPMTRVPKFSLYSPKRGDRVFYGGAPYGMISDTFLLTYEGYYSGKMKDNLLFSIPCASGASGSSIRNTKNEIISIVQKVHTGFNHICYGIGTESLRDFVFDREIK